MNIMIVYLREEFKINGRLSIHLGLEPEEL